MRAHVSAILSLAACSHPPRSSMPTNPCRAAIEAFAAADPAQLRALPATCTLADVTAVLTAVPGTSNGQLGSSRTRGVAVHYFSSPRLPDIHAWIDETQRVVLLDADLPPGDASAYTAALGAPEAQLDYPYAGAVLPQAEHVWPHKGAVVVVGAQLIRIGVFAPTTLADYQATLRRIEASTDD
jgi:hypothetical protein